MTLGHGIAISLDYGIEMLAFWRAKAPMTLSSQAGLALRRGERWTGSALLGRMLNGISAGHCEAAIVADIERCKNALQALTLVK